MTGSGALYESKRRLGALVKPENEEATMLALEETISKGWLTFDEVCRKLGVPRTRFLVWLQADEGRWGHFLKMHEARAIQYVSEAVRIADGEMPVKGVAAEAARDKLRVDARFRYA